MAEGWDHVVVGAGSAGCVIAARLAEAGLRVLVLEAGGHDRHFWVRVPLGAGRLLNDNSKVWRFLTEPDARTANRAMAWPRGRMLGGSSSINGMLWVRGDPSRWDDWGAEAPGWDWRSVAPTFRAVERTTVGDAQLRGRTGPVTIEELGHDDAMTPGFIQACVDCGIPANADYNGDPHGGVGRLQANLRRGRRQSMADTFLRPAMRHPNLAVRTNVQARRVVMEGRRAVGVELADGSVVRAERGVILAAGAIQSPQLLELSGIGGGARLQALGIPVVHDLPGVGENLSDHFHLRVTFRTRGVLTVNDLLNHPLRHGAVQMLRWWLRGDGLFGSVSPTAHALARTTPESTRPDMKLQLFRISQADRTGAMQNSGVDPFSGVSFGFFDLYPESRGSVHITSAYPLAPPRIAPNFLAAARDRAAAVRGLRLARRIAAQPALAPFILEETRPGPEADDDEALLDYARRTGGTSYHPVGTCRMGSGPDAVVDSECRVHGVDGLRVVDASAMPFLVSSNPNAPTVALAARTADLMLAERNRPA